jgi:hypothetical protein
MLIPMNKIASLALFALAATLAFPFASARADDDQNNVVIKSDDGKVQLSVPPGWTKRDSTTSGAALEARDEDSQAFIMVIVADRSDPYLTLDEYAKDLRDQILSHLVKSRATAGESFKIDDFKSIRYEIHGTKPDSKLPFGYYLTIIQMRRHYVQVISWSLEKHFQDNAQTLKEAAKNVSYSGDQ